MELIHISPSFLSVQVLLVIHLFVIGEIPKRYSSKKVAFMHVLMLEQQLELDSLPLHVELWMCALASSLLAFKPQRYIHNCNVNSYMQGIYLNIVLELT